jgi:hypothetical protein
VIGSKAGIVISSVTALAWSAHALAQKTTAEFASGATRPRSIALLPVEASVSRARVADSEGLVDDSLVYGEDLNAQLKELMAAKGYEVKVVDADQINTDPVLQEHVVDANRAFDDIMSKYKPKNLPKRMYNGGDSVRLLADHLDVDAVAFTSLNMTITMAGKAIVAALIGGSQAGTFGNMALVDGSTGDLEAMFFGFAYVTPGEKTDEEMHGFVVKVAEGVDKRLPAADPSARVEVAESDDDEVLGEVESLLER